MNLVDNHEISGYGLQMAKGGVPIKYGIATDAVSKGDTHTDPMIKAFPGKSSHNQSPLNNNDCIPYLLDAFPSSNQKLFPVIHPTPENCTYAQHTHNSRSKTVESASPKPCLFEISERLQIISQFSQSRIQMIDLSYSNNTTKNNHLKQTLDVCRQSFHSIHHQIEQTQQYLKHVSEAEQQREQRNLNVASEPTQSQAPEESFIANNNLYNRDKTDEFITVNDMTMQNQYIVDMERNDHQDGESLPPKASKVDADQIFTFEADQDKSHTQKATSKASSTLRSGYKRRAERPLPSVPPPYNGARQYTKQQAMQILVQSCAGNHPKDRNGLIADWIARKLVPVTAQTTKNKYVRDFRHSGGIIDKEWERIDDVNQLGISKSLQIPEPANGVEYTRREAVQILIQVCRGRKPIRDRNLIISSWIANGKIPLKSLTAVDRTIQQAEKEGLHSIQEHWGRWGDTQCQKRIKKLKAGAARREKVKTELATDSRTNTIHLNKPNGISSKNKKRKRSNESTDSTTSVELLPPYPPPMYGNEYIKLEAVSILQKISNVEGRNNVIWKWIHEKQIPITHPNSMTRILRDAKNGALTVNNMDWKDTSTAKTNLLWTSPPKNGSVHTKAEMIDILSKMTPADRNKLVRLWVHERKLSYTSALSANSAVVKAIRQKQESLALTKGEKPPVTDTSAIAATGLSTKQLKRAYTGEAESHVVAPNGSVEEKDDTRIMHVLGKRHTKSSTMNSSFTTLMTTVVLLCCLAVTSSFSHIPIVRVESRERNVPNTPYFASLPSIALCAKPPPISNFDLGVIEAFEDKIDLYVEGSLKRDNGYDEMSFREDNVGDEPRSENSTIQRYTVPQELHGKRIDAILPALLENSLSRSTCGNLVADGRVQIVQDNAETSIIDRKSFKVDGGTVLQVELDSSSPSPEQILAQNIPLSILYEDEHMIVLNKAAGMVVHPAVGNWEGTVVNALAYYLAFNTTQGSGEFVQEDGTVRCPKPDGISTYKHDLIDDISNELSTLSFRPGIVHRLDKGTTGILVVAKTAQALSILAKAFADRTVKKTYLAITVGNPGKQITIDKPIGRHPIHRQRMRVVPDPHRKDSSGTTAKGRQRLKTMPSASSGLASTSVSRSGRRALSYVDTLAFDGKLSVVQVQIATGRTHQIRVHLQDRHTPIYGDDIYGITDWNKRLSKIHGIERPLLHAYRLELNHPITDEPLVFEAPMADDMIAIVRTIWADGPSEMPRAFGMPGATTT